MSPLACLLSFLTMWMTSTTDQPNKVIIGSIAVAVEQGSPVELLCRWRQDDMFTHWAYLDVMKKSNEIPIYTMPTRLKNPIFTSIDVKHNNQTRSSVLIINATNMDNAGDYGCFTMLTGSLRQVTAELTVLTSPRCTSEDDAINVTEIRCSVDFRGRLQPTMTWTTDGAPDDKIQSEDQLANTSDSTKTLTSALKLPRHQTCGKRYSCDVFFNGTNRKVGDGWIESNVSEYHFRWTSNHSARCEDDESVKAESKPGVGSLTLILIGTLLPLISLLLLTSAIISKRRRFGKKESALVSEHEYAEANAVENENPPRNEIEISDYADIVGIEDGRELEPAASNANQFLRIERDGQVRILAPDGIEYMELNRQEHPDSPRPPAAAAAAAAETPKSALNCKAYVIAHHDASIEDCAGRHLDIATYENIEIDEY